MPSNVEIKARVADAEDFARRAAMLTGSAAQHLEQYDRFFAVPEGRLKLRCFADGDAELIFYRRADTGGPKVSSYAKLPVSDPESMATLLQAALGSIGSLRKKRRVWLAGRTRVHLDHVENLGTFMELEVVLEEGEPQAAGAREAQLLMDKLGVQQAELVSGAYLDLLTPSPAG